MGETQENWVTCPNGQSPYLKYHLQLSSKEDIGNGGLGLQRGRETIHMEMEKQRFDKQMFAGPCRNNETQSEHSSLVSCIQLFATPWTIWPARLLCPWNSSGKNTAVGCHFLRADLEFAPPQLAIFFADLSGNNSVLGTVPLFIYLFIIYLFIGS